MNIWVILFIILSVISLATPFIIAPKRKGNVFGEIDGRSGVGSMSTILLNLEQLDLDLATGKLSPEDHAHLKAHFQGELGATHPDGVLEKREEDGAPS